MSPERQIFQNSKRKLNILGASIFLALTVVFGSIFLRDSLKKNLSINQGLLDARATTLATKQNDLSSVRTHIAKYRLLKQQGLLGNAEREGWVEQLVATRTRLGVGESLNYTLDPPSAFSEVTPDGSGASATGEQPVPQPSSALMHELSFELGGAHESELLALIDDYREKVKGRFRVQSCSLTNPSPTGLQAQCVLRFFNLPEPAKPQ